MRLCVYPTARFVMCHKPATVRITESRDIWYWVCEEHGALINGAAPTGEAGDQHTHPTP